MSSAAGGFGNGEGASNNRMSMSMRGLVPYVASEKDCVDEQGEEAECVICFEEFESGDRMARLVCWCKFHEVSLSSFLFSFGWWGGRGWENGEHGHRANDIQSCIREWWDKKGRGACPTHQLQY